MKFMNHALWKIVAVIMILLIKSSAFADGPSAWLNINYTNITSYEDGEKVQASDDLFQNYYFRFDKTVNPLISYQLYLRTNISNSHTTDSEDNKTTIYRRAIEPAFDIYLRSHMYGITGGYRRLERWDTTHLSNDSRITSEFLYSRLDFTPPAFPFLSLQFDRERDYDHLTDRNLDTTSNRYSASSWYDFIYKRLKFSYNVTLTRNEQKTPTDPTISKSIDDNLNVTYDIDFHRSLWRNALIFGIGYQGNYSYSRSELHSLQTGTVDIERTPSFGMYGLGTQIEPDVDILVSVPTLNDNIYNVAASTSSGQINIGPDGDRYHNIGIQLLSSDRPVDTLYIYVNADVTADTNLTNPNNWTVYTSDFNLPDQWTEISVQSVTVSLYDDLNNIYRYEIRFFNPQNNLYFKAVNLETVTTVTTIRNIFVTEVEAYGRDEVPASGKITDTSKFFTQGINFNTTIKPISSLTLSLRYFLNRADQNPISIANSIGGAFNNIFSKSIDDDEELTTDVTRSYGATANWLTHRLLTTIVSYQRNEAFDNKNEIDFQTDTYSVNFNSTPLPTLDANLSLVRTYSYSFDEKQKVDDLYLLTLGARLYKGVNMVTDIGYTRSKNYALESEHMKSSTQYARGTLDALLTPNLSTNVAFGLTHSSQEDISANSYDGSIIVTYRPGRFINFSGNFLFSDEDGDISTREGLLMDWLFVPAVRMNVIYQHENREPQSVTSDIISGYVMWYITKFMNLQLTSSYTRSKEEVTTEAYNFGLNLSCRFW